MTTGNNLGVLAGVAFDTISGGPGKAQVALYIPDPRSITITGTSYPWSEKTVQSPGYVTLLTTTASAIATSQFYGTVAGINDHNNLALNEDNIQHSSSSNGGTTPTVPYLYSTTQGDVSLGSLGGTNGAASALNNSNQVVGWSQTAGGAQHAFVYSNGTMQDLNLLIPSSANIHLVDAVGIDGSGRIVAYGTDASGQMDEFLLTPEASASPVPEPSTLTVFGLMIAAVAVRQIRSRHAVKI
jgi:probable HAF family extracellular repeat protein